MINTIVAKTQIQFPYYLWGAEVECQLNKDTFDPLEMRMSITAAGKVKRREVDPNFKHSQYMGHYTEDTLPKEYLIREMVFLKSNMVRIISQQFDERLADRMIRDGNKVVSINCESYSRRKFCK